MKITYAPNPLRTVVELDEHDREILRLKTKVEQLEGRIIKAHFDLDPKHQEWHNKAVEERTPEEYAESARKTLRMAYAVDADDFSLLDKRVDELMGYYLEALGEPHDGDCTCVAYSCRKCHAEELLGIDTIAGLGKHPGSAMAGAFSQGRDHPERTIDEAIEYMRTRIPEKTGVWERYDDGQWATLTERWAVDRKKAHDWLVAYRDAHFPKEPCT